MKLKIIFLSICLLFLLAGAFCLPAVWAAGSVTQTLVGTGAYNSVLTFSWTGDAINGTVPATESTWNINGYIFLVETVPSTPVPSADYDITLTNSDNLDVVGGELANRSATLAEHIVPKINNVYGTRWVSGKITLNISNQSEAGAKGSVKVYIWSGRTVRAFW